MYAENYNGKNTLVIDINDDPEFKALIDKILNLQEELNSAIRSLRYYRQEYNLSCTLNIKNDSISENNGCDEDEDE